jgi:flavin reductase (DIM6/NTAB) family NADH-FMN oxidoreductase RutF
MSKIDVNLARATRLLQPGPVTIVTAKHKDKQNGMAAAWVTPISNDPPLVALAVYPARFTYELIVKSGTFALNIPPRPLAEKVQQLGTLSGEDVDKFVTTKLTLYSGSQISAPLIAECVGHIECGVVNTIQAGNHTLFIAEIIAASADDTAFDGEHWRLTDDSVRPLHHLGGGFYAVLNEPIQV